MKIRLQTLFSEFKEQVLDSSYIPQNPLETLKAHITALWLLQSEDSSKVKQAKAFLKISSFNEQQLTSFEHYPSEIRTWDELHICSTYTNINGTFLEYKLTYTTLDNQQKTEHIHARFTMNEALCYLVSQSAPLIRVSGDPILQKPGILFPEQPTVEQQKELMMQIEHARAVLIQTGGAGIAANQCAEIKNPYRFTIVGVFHENPEHAIGVAKRYPGTPFPQAMIMVNPLVTGISQETQPFNHACLSVPCANRCTVVSPAQMSVRYQDPVDAMATKEVTLTGIDAVVLWHELSHIVDGKTYMDATFNALPREDLTKMINMLHDEIQRRHDKEYTEIPQLSVPPFHLSVKTDENGELRLEPIEWAKALPNMTDETLLGLFNQANQHLKKKYFLDSYSPSITVGSIFQDGTGRKTSHEDDLSSTMLSAAP